MSSTKRIEDPEFILLERIQAMRKKREDVPEFAELEDEAKNIVKQNCLYGVQMVALYYLQGRECLGAELDSQVQKIFENIFDRPID